MHSAENIAGNILKYFKKDNDITKEIFKIADIRRTYALLEFIHLGKSYKMSFYNDEAYCSHKTKDYIGKITLFGEKGSISVKVFKNSPHGNQDIRDWIEKLDRLRTKIRLV